MSKASKKYGVTVPLFASYYVEVEAKSESDAIDKAYDLCPTSVCWQCSQELELNGVDEKADAQVEELE